MMTTGTTETLMTLGHSGKFTAASSLNFTVAIGWAPGCDKLPYGKGERPKHKRFRSNPASPGVSFAGRRPPSSPQPHCSGTHGSHDTVAQNSARPEPRGCSMY